jgi:hypothetical protein
MDVLIEKVLQNLYSRKDKADRIASELDTIDSDPLVIRFYEGKVEAYDEIIHLLINKKANEET